jgi:hypothetical protein
MLIRTHTLPLRLILLIIKYLEAEYTPAAKYMIEYFLKFIFLVQKRKQLAFFKRI